jgi:hypothetical protein
VGSLDLPDQPDEPGRPEQADTGGPDRMTPKSREMPDPDERGRVYEATRAYVSAETGERAEQGRQLDATEQRSYRTEMPRFMDTWAEHETRWPVTRRPSADLSSDAPGPRAKDSGSPSSPERHAETAAVGQVREAERGLSTDARAIQQENKYEGWLEGFEFRLKGEDRLKEKVAERLEGEPDKSPAEILHRIPDAIRYTFCFQPESYAKGYYDIKERLENRGHEMFYSKNSWTDPEYKGINTRWVTPEGQWFEVQFHTPDSFHAKHHVTHTAYERIRDPATTRTEMRELHAFQREVCSWIQVPDGATDIPDYKKEGF